MSERYSHLTVILEHDIKDEDAANLINAIQQIRGVLTVQPKISGVMQAIANQRAKQELIDALWSTLTEWK